MAMVPDTAIPIANGSASTEDGSSWSFSLHARDLDRFYERDEDKAAQRLPVRLTISGVIGLHLFGGGVNVSAHTGQFDTEIPYSALGPLIEALQKVKDEIPGIVAKEYEKHDHWRAETVELIKKHSKQKDG